MYCPDCFKGTIHDGTPRGVMETVHGISTYIAVPEGKDPTPTATILFITDIFGMKLVNNKLLADKYAADTGCRVLMPDVVPNGGATLALIDSMDLMNTSMRWYDIVGQVRRALAALHAVSVMGPMLFRTRNILPTILAYARAAKADMPAGGRLGVAGFCWGGGVSNLLAQQPAVDGGDTPIVEAHFNAHPSGANVLNDLVAAAKAFGVPLSLAIGDRDLMVPKEAMPSIEASLAMAYSENKDLYEVVVYEGCTHGFAVRADPKQEIEDKGAIAAAEQANLWFRKHLKIE